MVNQNICLRKPCLLCIQIVHTFLYLGAGKILWTFLSQGIHNALHLIHAGKSREGEAVHGIQIIAMLCINLLQTLLNGGAIFPVICRHLTNQHGGHHRVLIPHRGSGQVTIAFFEAENEAIFLSLFLQKLNLLSNPLKSGQGMAKLDAVILCHLIRKGSTHNGLYRHRSFRKGSLLLTAFRNVI